LWAKRERSWIDTKSPSKFGFIKLSKRGSLNTREAVGVECYTELGKP